MISVFGIPEADLDREMISGFVTHAETRRCSSAPVSAASPATAAFLARNRGRLPGAWLWVLPVTAVRWLARRRSGGSARGHVPGDHQPPERAPRERARRRRRGPGARRLGLAHPHPW